MAKSTVSKEEKKAQKAAAKAARKERWTQVREAFKMQRQEDKKLIPILIGVVLGVTLLFVGLFWLIWTWWIGLIVGLPIAVLVAMLVFARRVQGNVYKKAEGMPGAAAWSLQNNLRGRWRIKQAVAGTTQLDAVHRVIGRPGVVLVAEGASHRVKPLLAQEKKKISRVVGESVPIYDIIVGTEEGQTPLKKLNVTLMKLPRNISATEVGVLDTKLEALNRTTTQMGMPKGPMPQGAKMRNIQRATRKAR